MPVMWSKWPWLSTITSTSRGETSSRRMFSISPSWEMPVSNSTRCSRPPREIVTKAAKPCSARSASSVWPPSISGEGTRGARESIGARIAGPSSSNKMSVTLSTSVVIASDSTG